MKRIRMQLLMVAAIAIFLALTSLTGIAQQNNNSSKGQMKESGREVSKAGSGGARHVRHGRIVHGGKHFGRHMGRAGKHFGRGSKHAVKRAIS